MTPGLTFTTRKAAARAEAQRLMAIFAARGAEGVETPILQPAGALLDLYGEDIRARAYVTTDPLRGEMMLRPDFTLPIVQMHMETMAEPKRYAYTGEVFRRRETDGARASEFLQAGYEVFDARAPEAADAEVFATLSGAVADLNLRAATGDIGILRAAVEGLRTTAARKAALLRHLWRPRRFRALMDRYSGKIAMPAARRALLDHPEPMATLAPEIGRRGRDEVAARIAALREDAGAPPIAAEEIGLIEALLALRESAPVALSALRDLAVDLPAIQPAVGRLDARLRALAGHGIDPESLSFEGNFGRTSLEYYDGFVFGLFVPDRPDLPPVVSGGRYDALTRVLGKGRVAPAVGGIVRPELVVALRDGTGARSWH